MEFEEHGSSFPRAIPDHDFKAKNFDEAQKIVLLQLQKNDFISDVKALIQVVEVGEKPNAK